PVGPLARDVPDGRDRQAGERAHFGGARAQAGSNLTTPVTFSPGSPDRRFREPRASYRLQLGPGFGFMDAARVARYLRELGVSHAYLSPVLQAAPGSTHGYDVVDHTRVSDDLGGPEAYRALSESLEREGLGQLVDIVPNHMAIDPKNPWWWDVLENGPSGVYASYFDVEW